jgi:anti-sigma regulatory factor (Ser/Thr protein kinase)
MWEFPALAEQVPAARHTLSAWLAVLHVDDEVRADLELAFTEAFTNAVLHAYGGRDGAIVAHARLERDELTIRVSDAGAWTERRGRRLEGGRGLRVIEALVDDLQIHGTDQGTTVVMQKRLARSDEVEPAAARVSQLSL